MNPSSCMIFYFSNPIICLIDELLELSQNNYAYSEILDGLRFSLELRIKDQWVGSIKFSWDFI